MSTEKAHDRFNAFYFSFAAISFVAFFASLYWGGIKFLWASPFNLALVLIGLGYIALAAYSIKHAFFNRPDWLGYSKRGKSHNNFFRAMALILPLPIFGFGMFGLAVKSNLNDSASTYENVRTEFDINKTVFGYKCAEGTAWRLAKMSFNSHHAIMGDAISLLIAENMQKRGASDEDYRHFLKKHQYFDSNPNCSINQSASLYSDECESHHAPIAVANQYDAAVADMYRVGTPNQSSPIHVRLLRKSDSAANGTIVIDTF